MSTGAGEGDSAENRGGATLQFLTPGWWRGRRESDSQVSCHM